jgi:hypothetical protein
MSLDAAEMDLGKAFEYGQGYVALSRVRSLDGLKLLGFNAQALMVHPKILEYDKRFRAKSEQILEYLSKKTPEEMQKASEEFIVRAQGSIQKVDLKAREAEQAKTSTFEKTLFLVREGKSIEEIKSGKINKDSALNLLKIDLSKNPSRMKCALLVLDTVKKAVI